VEDILRGAPPPPFAERGIAFKTGTSYGFRDALAWIRQGRTIAVWSDVRQRAGGGPGWARDRGAVLLTLSPVGRDIEMIGGQGRAARCASAICRRRASFAKDAPKVLSATAIPPLRIAYPPDGAGDWASPKVSAKRLLSQALAAPPR